MISLINTILIRNERQILISFAQKLEKLSTFQDNMQKTLDLSCFFKHIIKILWMGGRAV
jgi:hypothetical protein